MSPTKRPLSERARKVKERMEREAAERRARPAPPPPPGEDALDEKWGKLGFDENFVIKPARPK